MRHLKCLPMHERQFELNNIENRMKLNKNGEHVNM